MESTQLGGIKLLIKKCIVATMALMSFLTLAFTVCRTTSIGSYRDTYAESGFSFLGFESQFFADSNGVGVFFIGFFCMLILLASIVVITLATFNVIFRKKFKADMPIIIISLITAFVYMVVGIIVAICIAADYADFSDYILVTTSAYVPFILQSMLLAGYIVISKVFPGEEPKVVVPATPVAQAVAQPQVVTPATPVATPVAPAPQKQFSSMEKIETLKKYAELRDSGILSEEEFATMKKDLLGL